MAVARVSSSEVPVVRLPSNLVNWPRTLPIRWRTVKPTSEWLASMVQVPGTMSVLKVDSLVTVMCSVLTVGVRTLFGPVEYNLQLSTRRRNIPVRRKVFTAARL